MQNSDNENLKDYFFEMEQMFQGKNDLKTLTELLSNNEFTETRPYLTRRKLIPKDQRFESIELVYETPESVRKICWHLDINLSRLKEYFGNPRFHYAPHGSATMIGFYDFENKFSGFETIHSGNVSYKDGQYVVSEDNGIRELKDELHVTFVSYTIDVMKTNKTTINKSYGKVKGLTDSNNSILKKFWLWLKRSSY